MSTPVTNFEKVREFNKVMEMTLDKWPPTREEVELRTDLITEELEELNDELFPRAEDWRFTANPDKAKVAKELADLLYVVYGTAASFGIPIDDVFNLVHLSNLSKLTNGKIERREDGKVLKGPDYRPPDLSWLK